MMATAVGEREWIEWSGDKDEPADWDGNKVLLRNGNLGYPGYWHHLDHMPESDIVGYKRREPINPTIEKAGAALRKRGLPKLEAEACARTVLQAIREPSEGMVEAAEDTREPCESGGYYSEDLPSPDIVWKAMIDAALVE